MIFDTGTASQAALARAWFAENPTQLTRYGLKCLKRTMGESEICVLFRNNHYNTVMKQNGQLYTLVSAAGFLQCPRFVFQKLTPAGADIEAFDGSFVRLREIYPSTELMPATGAAFAADNAADCEVMPGRKRNVGRILAGTPGGSTAGPSSAGPSRAGPSRAGPRRASGSKAGNSGRPPQESERRRRRLKQEEIDRRYAKRVQAIYDAQNSEKLPIVGQTARQHEPSSALESCVLM